MDDGSPVLESHRSSKHTHGRLARTIVRLVLNAISVVPVGRTVPMITGDVYSSKIIDSQAPDGITIHNKAGYSSLSQPPPLAASFREVNLEASSSWESRFESLVPVFFFFFKFIFLSRLASIWTGRLVTYYTST